ncbi:MAG: ZIP family metal transporter [Lachnospiraceae bacterium]|nr:ZIP family metal transporter [Lachnospiraceae bacterium]
MLCDSFPHGYLLAELHSPFLEKHGSHHDAVKNTNATFGWGTRSGKEYLGLEPRLNYISERSYNEEMKKYSIRGKFFSIIGRNIPAFEGFWLGILFLLFLDLVIPHFHIGIEQAEGPKSHLTKTVMLVLAVTLHNIPEGMAVGVVLAGLLNGAGTITAGSAFALALGIAIQNFPEGAIISMPLYSEEKSKPGSFILGVLSGAVEPVFGGLTVIIASAVIPAMPYYLSFAAGAMLYVVVEELIPEMSAGKHSNIGVVAFAFGFSLMMALDVALG